MPTDSAIDSLHLGLTPWVGDLSAHAHEIAFQAEIAENLGYESIWLPESHFLERGACPSPLLPLAAAAARTKTLRLGTTSYLLPVRHPVHVAEEIAVLDRLSQGRVILGLGRGFRRALFDVFDVPVREKRAIFEVSLETILRAWAGEPVPTSGGGTVRLAPLPLQSPHPPLWVAAFGPKALGQAGKLGLPYLASPIESFTKLHENYTLHRDILEENGHDTAIPVPLMRTIFVSEDTGLVEQARRALEIQAAEIVGTRPSGAGGGSASVDDWALVGRPDEVAEHIQRYRKELGMTHLIARGHIPRVHPNDLLASLTHLAELRA